MYHLADKVYRALDDVNLDPRWLLKLFSLTRSKSPSGKDMFIWKQTQKPLLWGLVVLELDCLVFNPQHHINWFPREWPPSTELEEAHEYFWLLTHHLPTPSPKGQGCNTMVPSALQVDPELSPHHNKNEKEQKLKPTCWKNQCNKIKIQLRTQVWKGNNTSDTARDPSPLYLL